MRCTRQVYYTRLTSGDATTTLAAAARQRAQLVSELNSSAGSVEGRQARQRAVGTETVAGRATADPGGHVGKRAGDRQRAAPPLPVTGEHHDVRHLVPPVPRAEDL